MMPRPLRKKLKKTGFDQITVILDKEATQRRILTELFHRLPETMEHNDRLFFYFAGHGQTEDLPKGGKRDISSLLMVMSPTMVPRPSPWIK